MKLAHFLTRWGEGFSRSWPPHGRRITFVRQGEGTQIRVASILRRRRFLAVCLLSFCAFMRQPPAAAPNLAITNIWELPFGRGRRWMSSGGVASAVLGGWQVNNILSLISGPPFTVYADGTSLNLPGSTQQADQVKSQVTKLGGIGPGTPFYDPTAFAEVTEARFGTSGFNLLRGPGIVNWDFGLFREFKLSERMKLQFRMESFNFSNTPHFATPEDGNTSVSDGSDFMVINSVTNLAREGIDERQFRFGLRISF